MRFDWTLEEVEKIYTQPLIGLLSESHNCHKRHNNIHTIQACSLISVKTGACPENCRYCAQSIYYKTNVTPQQVLDEQQILTKVNDAIQHGATRICLGAAWREIRNNQQFESLLNVIQKIKTLRVEVCCTFGMLNYHQAKRLKDAGVDAYNHNLDTSREFYPSIVTTRTYDERLLSLKNARKSGLTICCGGILGLGETIEDRIKLLVTLSSFNPHPESVPINLLTPITGTPFENNNAVPFWETLRFIATARIILPTSYLRLSSGRNILSFEQQTLCFMAGINSIFLGEKLLTVENASLENDQQLFALLGLTPQSANIG